MNRNQEITQLAYEIMVNITESKLPLHNIILKASRLSLLVDLPDNVKLFSEWAKWAEQNSFIVEAFQSTIDAAKDRDVSIASANPGQYVMNPIGNTFERSGIRTEAKQVVGHTARYRTETYNFALGVYNKWQFGNIAENIFEMKRKRAEAILERTFPDIHQRLNSIEQNLRSENPEDWKNAVASCRALIMDIADLINPPKTPEEKLKYLNRLKNFISPKIESDSERTLKLSLLEEVKNRIEFTSNLTQGGAHKDRPTKTDAENTVLYTYLAIADLMEIYGERNTTPSKITNSPSPVS